MADSNLAIVYDVQQIAASTLANSTAVTTGSKIDASRENGFRVTRTEWKIFARGGTAGDDPVVAGMAFGQNSTQITEALVADPQSRSVNAAAVLANDQTMRPVFPLAAFGGAVERVREGVAKPNWSAPETGNLSWFVFNFGPDALTTGLIINFFAKHFGVWLRD